MLLELLQNIPTEVFALPVAVGWLWPWQTADLESGVILDTSNKVQYGPYLPPDWNSGEFGPLQPVANVVTKVVKSTDRLIVSAQKDPTPQTETSLWGKITSVGSNSANFLQSTLNKVIIIVIIAAIGGVFLMSYVQAKGTQLAK